MNQVHTSVQYQLQSCRMSCEIFIMKSIHVTYTTESHLHSVRWDEMLHPRQQNIYLKIKVLPFFDTPPKTKFCVLQLKSLKTVWHYMTICCLMLYHLRRGFAYGKPKFPLNLFSTITYSYLHPLLYQLFDYSKMIQNISTCRVIL